MRCLELNGASYLQVLCGVMRLYHKQMCHSNKVDLQIQLRFESMLGHFKCNHTSLQFCVFYVQHFTSTRLW